MWKERLSLSSSWQKSRQAEYLSRWPRKPKPLGGRGAFACHLIFRGFLPRAASFAIVTCLAMFSVPLRVRCQERPLNVTGTFSTGYYNTYTRGEANQSMSFIPVGAKFDINGYYLSLIHI